MKYTSFIVILFLLSFFVKGQNTEIQDTTIYTIVEEMPKFQERTHKFVKYIIQNSKYEKQAKRTVSIDSRITVSFIVEKDGTLGNIHILEGNMDKDYLIQALKNAPKWKAGKHKGKFVRVKMTFPVTCMKLN